MTAASAVPSSPSRSTPPRTVALLSRRHLLVLVLAVGLLAAAVRVGTIFRGGGPHALSVFYDDGVYYAAASAVVFGRMPYRDFVLLHPPGIVWALLPFAWLGRLTTDSDGMAAARLAWAFLGGVNAALVAVVARRFGLVAALAGGVFYALWPTAVRVESGPLLEPLGTLALLVALALLSARGFADRRGVQVAAGAALGVALVVKIWWAVPVLIVLAYVALRYRGRALPRVALGAAVSATVVCLPYFLGAPGTMWRMVVLDQLGRGRVSVGTLERLSQIGGAETFKLLGRSGAQVADVGWVVLVVLAIGCALAAVSSAEGRLYACLTVAVVVVLLMAPSFFGFYAAFAAPMFALVVPAAIAGAALVARRHAAHRPRRRSAATGATVAVLGVLAVVAGAVESSAYAAGKPFPERRLQPVVASTRCVTSDSPWGLIELDALSKDFRNGCRVEIDVSGVTHDTLHLTRADGSEVARSGNAAWRRYLLTYLRSGQATIIMRAPSGDGITGKERTVIDSWPVLGRAGGYVVREPAPAQGAG